MVPFIFKSVFIRVHGEKADENWLENARNHGRINDLNKLLLRCRNSMSGGQPESRFLVNMKGHILLIQ